MQSAFISYSTNDETAVLPYEQSLQESGITVWRDKSGLRQGELWPMRLGKAIAEQDALLLFWSVNAAASHFVTLEWNTALALQKPIIPVLLDDTPLPEVLKSYHGFSDISQLNEYLLSSSPEQVQAPSSKALLSELKSAQDDAGQALEIVKQHIQQTIQQDHWRVGGNVYQVQGDLHVAAADQKKLSGLSRWSLRLGTGAVLLVSAILVINFDMTGQFAETFHNLFTEKTDEVITSGAVQDENGNPLEGVVIQVAEWGVETRTDDKGRFRFTVSAGAEKIQTTYLSAQKIGYTPKERNISLGNSAFRINLERK